MKTELETLRDEVAALRAEVAQLRAGGVHHHYYGQPLQPMFPTLLPQSQPVSPTVRPYYPGGPYPAMASSGGKAMSDAIGFCVNDGDGGGGC